MYNSISMCMILCRSLQANWLSPHGCFWLPSVVACCVFLLPSACFSCWALLGRALAGLKSATTLNSKRRPVAEARLGILTKKPLPPHLGFSQDPPPPTGKQGPELTDGAGAGIHVRAWIRRSQAWLDNVSHGPNSL